MVLAIDIGNTRSKGAVFEADALLHSFACNWELLENQIEILLTDFPELSKIVLSNVGNFDISRFSRFQDRLSLHFISRGDKFPFQNCYASPETLGIDRMILASGAVLQFPGKNRLIIDAGTCITYDFVASDDVYFGGAISPGIRLRYEAMHNYTAKLPMLEAQIPKSVIGDSTTASMHSGVVNGVLFEIAGFIDSIGKNQSNFIIILTGGDAEFLAKQIKNTIFANPNFLLESLNRTFQYILND